MKRYRIGRLSMGWQMMIELALGIIWGLIFYQHKGAISVMQSLGKIFIRLIHMFVMTIFDYVLTGGISKIGTIRQFGWICGNKLL